MAFTGPREDRDHIRELLATYADAVIRLKDGTTRQVVGEYTDRVVRVNARWLFEERAYRVLMAG